MITGVNLLQEQPQARKTSSSHSARVPRWKRVVDVICILLASPVLVPVMAIISILIKLGSKGPVLFRQERIGHLGQRFTCLKFRTMVVHADTSVHEGHCARLIDSDLPMVKMDSHGDSRVIPFGRQLRATGLDELPQIINVLRGEMSLVGPRPCLACEYDRHLDWQRERFNTLPGLTGLWQVSGKNSTTFNQMIRLDLQYDRNKSVWLDLSIMMRTIPALVMQVREMRSRKEIAAFGRPATGAVSPLKPISQPIAYTKAVSGGTPVPISEPVIVEEESWRSR
ncbi:MAG TPA: sugar transferase [Verrucomicrobiae bacterium]|nr:sugar transferase [Verrucomicrobiae bacterium]